MRTKFAVIVASFLTFLPVASIAGEHGPDIFHAFRLETDIGNSHREALTRWDLDGWIGGDTHKLWLKSEGEVSHKGTEQAEFWAMYSRNVAEFWDVQAGVRQDIQPQTTTYFTLGLEGLAPYYFKTEAHVFLSERGNVSVRIKERYDVLITQKLVVQPYLEVNASAQNVEELGVGSGIASAEAGVQTRYEFSRAFAPYVDLRYESKFGNTARLAQKEGENRDGFIASVGLRLMF